MSRSRAPSLVAFKRQPAHEELRMQLGTLGLSQCMKNAALYYFSGLRIMVKPGGCDCAAYARA